MQYTARNGTKVTITHEAAGRIHSIRVKNKPPQKPTKIRIASPRMRATSPRVRAENISPTIVSIEQDEMVHLVVNKTSPVNVDPEPQVILIICLNLLTLNTFQNGKLGLCVFH